MGKAGLGAPSASLEGLCRSLRKVALIGLYGRLTRAAGLVMEALCPSTFLGEMALIETATGLLPAEVVGFRDKTTLLMPLGETEGVPVGAKVRFLRRPLQVCVSENLIGRILDGLGRPLDGQPLPPGEARPVYADPPPPLDRPPITEPLPVGVRAIDAFLTLGKGQRVGIFAGSGVGKSTLLGMMARFTRADVVVIALIGERGREVREFLERHLSDEGRKRTVVIVATADAPPILRFKGAFVAMTVAEFFRDEGADVLFLMDSLTRWAMAGREIGLALGEPPTSRGYTPSIFAQMPRFLERAGNSPRGSITALVTVLVEGDDLNDPIADHARAILDGHIVLSRPLAEQGHYPPVDVLASLSRVMGDVVDEKHRYAAQALRGALATLRDNEDLLRLGAYREGNDPALDKALGVREALGAFLRQSKNAPSDFPETQRALLALAEKFLGGESP